MNVDPEIKIIELRNYLLRPGRRDSFIDYFENYFLEPQNVSGGHVLGQFRVGNEDDRFFWIRGFEDMQSRLAFLRGFYEVGEVWKQFGPGANAMMLDSDHVHLLKPLCGESFGVEGWAKEAGAFVIDLYFANPNQLDKLADLFQTDYVPFLKHKPSLWVCEMSENDFPRLPVIQDRNLLVAITPYRNESDYQSQSKQAMELKNRARELIRQESSLIIYPTAKSLAGGGVESWQ